MAEAYAKADSWTGKPNPEPVAPEPHPNTTKSRITIEDACKVFVTNRESAELAPATLRKYRTFTKQITAYAERRGYVMLDQLTPADIDLFWATWKLGARAKGKRLHTLRAFFRFCVIASGFLRRPSAWTSRPRSVRAKLSTRRPSPMTSCNGSSKRATS